MVEKIGTALEDKETVFNKSQYHIGDHWEIYTTDIVDMRRYEKLALKYPDEVKILKDDKYSMTFSVPLKWVRVSAPRKMTEEQIAAATERLSAARAAQNVSE